MPKSLRAIRSRRERGTSTVEMAIVLPLLLTLLFGIGEFGVGFMQWQALVNAAREGARVGVVFRDPCNSGDVQTEVQQTVQAYAGSLGVQVQAGQIQLAGACGGTGQPLSVRVQVPYDFPALSAIAGLLPTVNLTANSVMRNE